MLKKVNFVYSDPKLHPIQALNDLSEAVNELLSENPDEYLIVSEARVVPSANLEDNCYTAYCTVIAPDAQLQPFSKSPFD